MLLDRTQKLEAMIRMSLRSLMLHKLRSFLTVLGLVFGVASVIIMLAIGEGASLEAQRQIESLGIQNVIVQSKKPIDEEDRESRRRGILEYGLTFLDQRRIEETLDQVERVTPLREFLYEARFQDQMLESRLVGVLPDFADANAINLTMGRFIQSEDQQSRSNVCVLGSEIARKLFRFESPIGRSVQVANQHYFRVIGVAEYKMPSGGSGSSLAAQDFNRDIYIPLATDHARMGELLIRLKQGTQTVEKLQLSQLTVKVRETDHVKQVAAAIQSLLSNTHEKTDFSITIPLDLLERRQATKRIFNFVLGSIAAISLLVGGIGIMNIMLATVSERTIEIGIRRALGAKKKDITLQFLVETSVLSATGAMVGVAVGVAIPPLVSYLSDMETKITIWAPLLAILVAMSVGILFGLYPARRAAQLDPIEALRHF